MGIQRKECKDIERDTGRNTSRNKCDNCSATSFLNANQFRRCLLFPRKIASQYLAMPSPEWVNHPRAPVLTPDRPQGSSFSGSQSWVWEAITKPTPTSAHQPPSHGLCCTLFVSVSGCVALFAIHLLCAQQTNWEQQQNG